MLALAGHCFGGILGRPTDFGCLADFGPEFFGEIRIGVGLGWVHDASNASVTSLAVHEKRGIEGIEAIGVLTDYSGTIVHDGLATYDTEELASPSCTMVPE